MSFAPARRVEETQLNPLCSLGKQGKVHPFPVPSGSEGVGSARPNRYLRLRGQEGPRGKKRAIRAFQQLCRLLRLILSHMRPTSCLQNWPRTIQKYWYEGESLSGCTVGVCQAGTR